MVSNQTSIAQQRLPALVLTDLMMPGMNGQKLIAALREAFQQHTPPIIRMTAAGIPVMEMSHADACLPKPFELAEVEALLQQFLLPQTEHNG